MRKVTLTLLLMAMALSASMNSMLHANERLIRDAFYPSDKLHQQWVSEEFGRMGLLEVQGALLSSPCTLVTREVALPLKVKMLSGVPQYPLTLSLTGCGEGGAVTSTQSPQGRSGILVAYSGLLKGSDNGVLQPKQRMLGMGKTIFRGGSNQVTWFLNREQAETLVLIRSRATDSTPFTSPVMDQGLLRLRLDYE